ncbi:MAG: putative VisC protein [Pseudomonadota bacterium]|jgi:2-polyprenylphenol 6-hydroxylase
MSLAEESGTDFDIVIVGAGIVGLTLASHLQDQGLRIAIINKDAFRIEKGATCNLRVLALTLASQQSLDQLNVWQRLDSKEYAPFVGMQVWESQQTANLFFDSADTGVACLGYIIKNSDLEHGLYAQAKTDKELTWYAPNTLIKLQIDQNQALLTLDSGIELTTNLVVGADGAQSQVRQLADIQIKSTDYAQCALIATVETELTHKQIASQIFLPNGPLAFLPLKNPHHCSIVWSNIPAEVKRLLSIDDESFCKELTAAFEQRLGKVVSTSSRLSYPLKIQEAEQYIKLGIALIGDAAHTIHPLAGQGANLGIADAQCLAKVILEAKQKHRSISAFYTLRRYERERRFYNRIMMGGVDGIKHLFASSHPLIQRTRQFGLGMLNNISGLKNVIARYAMGNLNV